MVHNLSVLGSTGSIGTQTLDVARKLGIGIAALCAHSNIALLEEQVRAFRPARVAVFDEKKAKELRLSIADTATEVFAGMDGVIAVSTEPSADLVVNGLVGMVGLRPTLEAASAKKDIAFANKETLVAGGALVTDAVRKNGVRLYPVDSEHSAIFQCLQASPPNRALKKIILTASGGPFFGRNRDDLRHVTVEEALRHPNWSMGAKITIDSATMMNKGLEIIEAAWLFDMSPDDIEVVVHRESIIHSMIEFDDHAVLAQLGIPDMRIPIQYAITYPERYPSPVQPIDWTTLSSMTFYTPDEDTFMCLRACKDAMRKGGLYPAIANGANEEANRMFRDGEITFLQIGEIVRGAVDTFPYRQARTLDDVLIADSEARLYARSFIR